MDTTRPIIVGYDGSPDAELALAWGVRTAGLTGADLRVVVAAPDGRHHEEVASTDRTAAQARDGVPSTGAVLVEEGEPLPVLMKAAAEAGLVVVGSRGHNRLESQWLGSVSQHLAGHAPCPVAVVRPTGNPRAHQILVGLDGSEPSARALEFAAARARLTGETLVAVHAYQLPTFTEGGRIGALATDIDTTRIDTAEQTAAELVAGMTAAHPDVEVRSTAVVGRAGRVLSRLSDDASLVVVGSRGRTAVEELVLGSVSQETLYRAECPVVVVR